MKMANRMGEVVARTDMDVLVMCIMAAMAASILLFVLGSAIGPRMGMVVGLLSFLPAVMLSVLRLAPVLQQLKDSEQR